MGGVDARVDDSHGHSAAEGQGGQPGEVPSARGMDLGQAAEVRKKRSFGAALARSRRLGSA